MALNQRDEKGNATVSTVTCSWNNAPGILATLTAKTVCVMGSWDNAPAGILTTLTAKGWRGRADDGIATSRMVCNGYLGRRTCWDPHNFGSKGLAGAGR
jgi:hypothetical protein